MKPQKSMQELWNDSYLSGDNDAYLEELYETYLKTPDGVAPEWRDYFKQLGQSTDVSHSDIRNYFADLARQPHTIQAGQGVDLFLVVFGEKDRHPALLELYAA